MYINAKQIAIILGAYNAEIYADFGYWGIALFSFILEYFL